jgi:hypothetical protein
LVIGLEATSLFAHQGLLLRSRFLAEACQEFDDAASNRRILLPEDNLAATSAVLEYLYRSDYFPSISNNTSLEVDPTVPAKDDEGVALLRHGRVYTLAKKLGLSELASLAHRKIHLTSSTARGEIAYARFVYKETSADDEGIRKPIAAFWASRSYVLRHEAEQEFKKMCLEFPQFGFDVLSLVLDQQERNSQKGSSVAGPASRKRQRAI